MKVTVVGAGAWGTALGLILDRNQHAVTFWGHQPATLQELSISRTHPSLAGVKLPETFTYEPDLNRAVTGSDAVVMAVPSKAFRAVAAKTPASGKLVISVTKGIEYASGSTMSAVLRETIRGAQVAALSGPTFALEVAKGAPAAIVAAAESAELSKEVQAMFHRPKFRVYSSTDLLGVELGGALKNVIAIAAGIGDGLGLGDNSKAALVTRALAEMKRLGLACGAHPETFWGLSGLGDLTATCFSRLSRNRLFGEKIGRGATLAEIAAAGAPLAEGYPTTRSAWRLAQRQGVETPIIEQVHSLLYEGKDFRQALEDLTARGLKAELD